MPIYDKLLRNARTLNAEGHEVNNQAIAIKEGRIAWCGLEQNLPVGWQSNSIEDCHQQLITPGLIDCHTHLVYAGNRAHEFKLRLKGMTYQAIAEAGGGIISTVHATRKASKDELLAESWPRLMALLAEGVTTVEIKSGYGLDRANEIKMLQVARELEKYSGMRIKTTFLGAHSVPPEFAGKTQDYVNYLCNEMLPEIAALQLADAVDVFCESIAFNLKQTQQLFEHAVTLGLPIKCHAEQLTNLGASELAASMGALSCDHLEHLNESGVEKLAQYNTVAVLLPGAYYFLKEHHLPPIDSLRAKKVGIAIATDCNPGSSPTTSLLLMLSMACRYFSLTVPEALAAVTTHAAKALGLEKETGVIKPGFAADLVRWSINDSAIICYYFGTPIKHETMINGNWIDWNETNQLFKE